MGLLSTIGKSSGAGLLDMELLFADTSTGRFCRLGRHRSTATDYFAEPHAAPSPSGTRVVFASDWGSAEGEIDTYVHSQCTDGPPGCAATCQATVAEVASPPAVEGVVARPRASDRRGGRGSPGSEVLKKGAMTVHRLATGSDRGPRAADRDTTQARSVFPQRGRGAVAYPPITALPTRKRSSAPTRAA